MNKYQEALGELEWLAESDCGSVAIDEVRAHTNTLQELVDRATPKKPIAIGTLGGKMNVGECPNCGSPSVSERDKYCYECGQALDWSNHE